MSRREEENPSPLEDPHGHPFQRASLYPDMNGHLPRVSAPDVGMVGPSDVPTRPLQAWRFPDTPSGVVGASGVAQTIWTPTNEGTSFDASIGNSHHAVAQTNPYLDAAAMPPSEMFNHDNHGGVLNVGSMPAIGLSSHDNRGFHLGGQQVHNPRDSPYEKAGQFAFFGSNPELQEGVGLRDSYPISFQSNVRYNHRPKHPESQPVGSDAIDAHAIFDHGGDPTQPALTLGEDIAVPRTFDSSYLPQHAPWTPYRDVHAGWPSYNPSWGNGGSPQESMNKALSPPVPKPEGISSVDSSLENSASEGQKEIKLCQKPIPQEDPPSGSNRERPGQFPAKRSRGKRTGPLNPEQKKHARDMRKQGACDVCSSRKIRCTHKLGNDLQADDAENTNPPKRRRTSKRREISHDADPPSHDASEDISAVSSAEPNSTSVEAPSSDTRGLLGIPSQRQDPVLSMTNATTDETSQNPTSPATGVAYNPQIRRSQDCLTDHPNSPIQEPSKHLLYENFQDRS